jgi:LacI family transcriptional regulator
MAQTTMKDVAAAAGVSISTVSRVLGGDISVDEQVRQKVTSLAEKLKYERRRAREDDLASHLVTLIVPNVTNPFYSVLLRGIERVARLHGYGLVLYDSEESLVTENRNLETFMERRTRGLIHISSTTTLSPLIGELVEARFPLVLLDRTPDVENANVVRVDNEEGAYQATKYLLRLGHTRIVYIAGTRTSSTDRDRFKGYGRALEEEGIAVDPELIVNGEYSLEKTYEAMKAITERGVDFSAIFSSNDLMAFGARQALEELNLRIPDDKSIVGFDDINLANTIGLTVISQPIVELGQSAMTLLLDLMEKRVSPPQLIVHRPSLVIRNSCRRKQ